MLAIMTATRRRLVAPPTRANETRSCTPSGCGAAAAAGPAGGADGLGKRMSAVGLLLAAMLGGATAVSAGVSCYRITLSKLKCEGRPRRAVQVAARREF